MFTWHFIQLHSLAKLLALAKSVNAKVPVKRQWREFIQLSEFWMKFTGPIKHEGLINQHVGNGLNNYNVLTQVQLTLLY